MIVNVSPIDVGHVLFVPEPESCLPQVSHLKIIRFPSSPLLFLLSGIHGGFHPSVSRTSSIEWS